MHNRYTAIVVRYLETPHKVALIDRTAGRVDGVVLSLLVPVGALIEYSVDKQYGTVRYLQHQTIIAMPNTIARADILFWHHILELCYYFVPLGSFTHELFELLEFLYTVDGGKCWYLRSKKLYLFKLLVRIGVYTRLPKLPDSQIRYLQALPLYMIAEEVIDDHGEKILDEWLRLCVYEHPAIRKFSTIKFLLAK